MKKDEEGVNSWLGFDSRCCRLLAGDGELVQGMLAPKQFVGIVQRPQVPWRGRRLFTWSGTAASFLIHEIRVGNRVTTAAACVVPADAFATGMDRLATADLVLEKDGVFRLEVGEVGDKLGTEWDLPMAHPGTEVTLQVENIGSEPARFIAGFLGKAEW